MKLNTLAMAVTEYGRRIGRRVVLSVECDPATPNLGFFEVRSIDNGPPIYECSKIWYDDVNRSIDEAIAKFVVVIPEFELAK